MKYLIVKCDELGDQFECDADRTPMYMTDDWMNNYPKDYRFEVWELLENGTFECIKDYDTAMEEGMFFGYENRDDETEDDNLIIIKKFPNRTRNDKCPKDILAKLKKMEDYDNSLYNCGTITGIEDGKYYIYGEYWDDDYNKGY